MLTNEELIEKAKQGDKESYELLFKKNDKFNYHVAKRYKSTGCELEELANVARFGMLKAYNSYQIDKGTKFITYASIVMENEILMFIRKYKRYRNEMSMQQVVCNDSDGNEKTLEETLESQELSQEEIYEKQEEARELNRAIKFLDERSQKIIQMKYFENKTQKEISNELMVSQSYVSRLTIKACEELKKIIEGGTTMILTKKELSQMIYIFDKRNNKEIEITFDNIAEMFDICQATVTNYNKKYKKGEYDDMERIPIDVSKYEIKRVEKDNVKICTQKEHKDYITPLDIEKNLCYTHANDKNEKNKDEVNAVQEVKETGTKKTVPNSKVHLQIQVEEATKQSFES